MRAFLCIFISLLCACDKSCAPVPYEISEKEKLADRITHTVALKLRRDLGLIQCGTGGGMMYQIRMLALSFDYYKIVDIEEGRKLLVAALNEYISAVNADEQVRPYLQNYPFCPKNIQIRIFIRNTDPSFASSDKIQSLSVVDGYLKYYVNEPNANRFKVIYSESYEEAVQKLSLEQKNAI